MALTATSWQVSSGICLRVHLVCKEEAYKRLNSLSNQGVKYGSGERKETLSDLADAALEMLTEKEVCQQPKGGGAVTQAAAGAPESQQCSPIQRR